MGNNGLHKIITASRREGGETVLPSIAGYCSPVNDRNDISSKGIA